MSVVHGNALEVYGRPLRYRLPFRGKGGNFRTRLNSAFIKQLSHPVKEYLPLLDLWSGGEVKLIVADFDRLPDGYSSEHWSSEKKILWEDFRRYLHYRYGKIGLVLISPSGKAKIVFKISLPNSIEMTREIALDTLQILLEESDFAVIDRSAPAARLLFLNSGMYRVMRDRLDPRPIIQPVLDSLEEGGVPQTSQEHRWKPALAAAPELDALDGVLDREVQWFLARFLAGAPELANECIGLSQPYLVRQSAHWLEKPFSQRSLSEGIASLIAKGLLSVIDDSFAPGRKSKLYRAEGVLRNAMDALIQKRHSGKVSTRPAFLDEDLPDGMWDATLWKATNWFGDEASFLEWATGKNGIEHEGRFRKAKAAWRNHIDARFNHG